MKKYCKDEKKRMLILNKIILGNFFSTKLSLTLSSRMNFKIFLHRPLKAERFFPHCLRSLKEAKYMNDLKTECMGGIYNRCKKY